VIEETYAEVTRQEIFERLGMAHTCCNDRKTTTLAESEKRRLRGEDKELASQLEDLMAEYKKARSMHGDNITDFWTRWWQVVDEILPPLLRIEACRSRLLRWQDFSPGRFRQLDAEVCKRRADREQNSLRAAGYGGPEFGNFQDVIREHFANADWTCNEGYNRKESEGETFSDDDIWSDASSLECDASSNVIQSDRHAWRRALKTGRMVRSRCF
jgi:hypothetical protein